MESARRLRPPFLALLIAVPLCAQQSRPSLWKADFDAEGSVGNRWSLQGKGAAAAPAPSDPAALKAGVGKRFVRLTAVPDALFATKPLAPNPSFDGAAELVVLLRAPSASATAPVVLDAVVLRHGGRGGYRRKFAATSPEWTEHRLPLKWFRRRDGPPIPWKECDRVALSFRTADTVELGKVEIRRGDAQGYPHLAIDEIAAFAFPESRPARIARRGLFAVATDDPRLPLEPILDAVVAAEKRLSDDFPDAPPLEASVPLLVFRAEADYRAFWPRFAAEFGGEAAPPTSDGFTALDVASSSVKEGLPLRPVFVHEPMHVAIGARLRVENDGNWLQEGLAVRYQLAFEGKDLAAEPSGGVDRAKLRKELAALLDGRKVTTHSYWQSASFLEWCLSEPSRAKALRAAVAGFRTTGVPNLPAVAVERFGRSAEALESEWLEWARSPSRPGGAPK
jgi:hypothetical protein